MTKEQIEKLEEITYKKNKVQSVINVAEKKFADNLRFGLLCDCEFVRDFPIMLPKDMFDEILSIVYKYRDKYEKEIEEL